MFKNLQWLPRTLRIKPKLPTRERLSVGTTATHVYVTVLQLHSLPSLHLKDTMRHSCLKVFALVPSFWNSFLKSSHAGIYWFRTQVKCHLKESCENSLFKAMLFKLFHVMRHTQNGICLAWHKGELTDLAGLPAILKAWGANISIPLKCTFSAKDHQLGWSGPHSLTSHIKTYYYTLKSGNSGSVFK